MTFVWGLRGEITKLRSLRSTYVTLVVMITATAGLGALISLAIAANWHSISPSERALFDPSASSLEGMPFGQLIVAVLGALTISTEYSTGMIRTALAARPNRIAYLTVKATAFTLVAFAAGVATTATGWSRPVTHLGGPRRSLSGRSEAEPLWCGDHERLPGRAGCTVWADVRFAGGMGVRDQPWPGFVVPV